MRRQLNETVKSMRGNLSFSQTWAYVSLVNRPEPAAQLFFNADEEEYWNRVTRLSNHRGFVDVDREAQKPQVPRARIPKTSLCPGGLTRSEDDLVQSSAHCGAGP